MIELYDCMPDFACTRAHTRLHKERVGCNESADLMKVVQYMNDAVGCFRSHTVTHHDSCPTWRTVVAKTNRSAQEVLKHCALQ
jgi:hypothetical protein